MALSIGVAIHRRWACVLAVEMRSGKAAILHERELSREPEKRPAKILKELLSDIPSVFRKGRLSVALSAGDLACSDSWTSVDCKHESSLSTLAPTPCDASCAA